MEPAERGLFVFYLAVILFLAPFFEFGLLTAGGRVLALASDRESEKRALGALLLLTLALGFAFSTCLFGMARAIDVILGKTVQPILVIGCAFGLLLPLQSLVEQSCVGMNRIRALAEFQLLVPAIQLALVCTLVLTNSMTARRLLAAYLAAIVTAAIFTVTRLGVRFRETGHYLGLTFREERRYGFSAYLARRASLASGRFDTLIVTYLLGYQAVGLYDSMQKLSNPIVNIARATALTRFKAYTRLSRIPSRMIKWNAVGVIALSACLALAGPPLVRIVFPKYAAGVVLLPAFALFGMFSGLVQPYNVFLSSHGLGSSLRNIALAVSGVGLIGLMLFSHALGIRGAAGAAAGAMALNYLLHLRHYRRHESSEAGLASEASKRTALVVDLAEDEHAARIWARRALADFEVVVIYKAQLRWHSRIEALRMIRSQSPSAFAIFTADIKRQNSLRSMLLFGVAAGAKRIIAADRAGRSVDRSRAMTSLFEGAGVVVDVVVGYGLIVPMAWALSSILDPLARILKSSVSGFQNRGVACQQRSAGGAPKELVRRSVLYLRALPIAADRSRPNAGGMVSHVTGFTKAASALGHSLLLLSCGRMNVHACGIEVKLIEPSTRMSANRATFEIWNSLLFSGKVLWLRLRNRTELSGLDFIYQRYNRFNFSGMLLSLVTRLPLLIEYNGSEVWISRNWDPVGQRRLLKKIERLNQNAADLIVVVSQAERRNLLSAGVPDGKILVNPNGVDVERFRPACGGERIRTELRIEGKLVIGFCGTFGPWHDTECLARAAVSLRDDDRFHFLFIGDGVGRPATEQIFTEADCWRLATFSGLVSYDTVPAYLDACDILVCPHSPPADGSEFFNSPTKLFECLAMSRPVIASSVGQIKEIVVNLENGITVEPGSAEGMAFEINRLAGDPDLRRRLGEAGRQTVLSGFTWRHNAERVFEEFGRVFG